jgi:flagellin
MTVINTNIGATITANALAKNERAMNTAMERLSTGKRINSAADDAAGLAISQRLNAQVKGLDQAARNANDAISMLQTADGAAIEITNMLQRMRELAVQATSDSNTSDDVANLDLEFKALAEEIDRIVDATQWNGENILDGTGGDASDGSFTFQIGANDGQTVSVDFSDFNLAAGSTGSAVQGTVDVTIDLATLNALGTVGANANAVIQFNDGENIIEIDQAKILAAGATDFSDATLAQLVTAITTELGLAVNDDFEANFDSVAVSNTGITFTQATGGTGSLGSAKTSTDGTTFTSLTAAVGTAGVAANTVNPMGEDLSGMTASSASITTETANIIATLDTAISGVTTQRATFGAVMNRLEYTVDNLSNVSQNTSASMSRIADADYAAETTELARTQIIQQAGTAMLSQANQQAQSVLALLK